MRFLLAALVLASCATDASTLAPDQRLRGCWIDRGAGVATTMRWLPDPANPAALAGWRRRYPGNAAEAYTLTHEGEGWQFCEINAPGGRQCWRVAEGEEGSLDGGRAFIDAHADRLRISVLGAGPEHLIFQGHRDGCD